VLFFVTYNMLYLKFNIVCDVQQPAGLSLLKTCRCCPMGGCADVTPRSCRNALQLDAQM
jgi:hypothetical protein